MIQYSSNVIWSTIGGIIQIPLLRKKNTNPNRMKIVATFDKNYNCQSKTIAQGSLQTQECKNAPE